MATAVRKTDAAAPAVPVEAPKPAATPAAAPSTPPAAAAPAPAPADAEPAAPAKPAPGGVEVVFNGPIAVFINGVPGLCVPNESKHLPKAQAERLCAGKRPLFRYPTPIPAAASAPATPATVA